MSSDDAFDTMFEPDGTPIMPSPKYAHQPCDECDPSFIDCWTARSLCRKKPLSKPAESQAAGEWIVRCAADIASWLDTVRNDDPAIEVADFVKIIAKHAPPDQSQQLAAAQARIASLEHMQEISSPQIRAGAERIKFADNQRDELKSRVDVLEKALERCDECLNEDIISAVIIKAENKARNFA